MDCVDVCQVLCLLGCRPSIRMASAWWSINFLLENNGRHRNNVIVEATDLQTVKHLFDFLAVNRCSDLQKWNGWNEMRIVRGTGVGVVGYNFFGCLTLATVGNHFLNIVSCLINNYSINHGDREIHGSG